MTEILLSSGLGIAVVSGIFAYGRLYQRVESNKEEVTEHFGILRKDIARLDERIADLADFLIREAHGEDSDGIRKGKVNR